MIISPAAASSAVRRPRRPRLRRSAVPYLFVAPFVLVFALFFLVPILYAFNLSLFLDHGVQSTFVGLSNYIRVLQDSGFYDGIGRMLVFGLVQVPVALVLALSFALLLDSGLIRGKTFFLLSYFLPMAAPSVVAVLMWGYLYSRDVSVVSQVLRALHLPIPDWMGTHLTLWSIGNIVTWEGTGFTMVLLFTALQAIPQEIYEAARIDGCNGWQVAWHIKVPLLRPMLVLNVVLGIIGTLQLFTEPQLLSQLGATISDSYTPNLYAYNYAFNYGAFNYSAAIAFTLTVLTFVLSYGFMYLIRRRQEAQ